jgi:hypothetical protein
MTVILLPTCIVAAILCLVATSARERRREERIEVARVCTASVLGREETRTSGRVLNVSRSGMRIAVAGSFVKGAQVMVEWEDEFFIGTVRNGFEKGNERAYGLRLVSRGSRRAW